MKKIVFVAISCMFFSFAFSQETPSESTPNTQNIKITNRPADHLMIQLSSDHLSGMTDSISSHQKGFSRGFNAYFMLDKPFKSSPKYSIGFGLGISTSSITFSKMNIDLKSTSATLPFSGVDGSNHFKKYKLAISYLEIPVEFRFTAKPSSVNKSLKAALGIKVGTLVNAHTKGKNLMDKNGNLLNSYTEKENSKRFISSQRFMATARIGYGVFSLFGAYQINTLLKQGAGPTMNLYQVGITISGL
ncbi:MAG: outer membrane beta-barrel protein [Bacteroidota bacterium]|nr:outer membrane beta-barrel protein [Bacteroidota bacterium]